MDTILTAAQMREAEETEIRSGAVTGLGLMERAGQGVVQAVLREWPDLAPGPRSAVVLCGPGNNGGDGFVIARRLKARGWVVTVHLLGAAEALPRDARVNHDRWAGLGPVLPLPVAAAEGPGPGLVVDALLGTGLTRGLGPGLAQDALRPFDGPAYAGWRRVAVDIPSGLCADSGRVLGDAHGKGHAFRADLTVTFHRRKPGHVLSEGPRHCGRVVVHDIGLRPSPRTGGGETWLTERPAAGRLDKREGHKYGHGHALILTGGAGRTGAARLAARGALRIGAGLVTLGVPGAAQMECAAQVTAIMLRRVDGAEALADTLTDSRLSALCLGPALGLDRARDLVPVALATGRATVLDADALTAFSPDPERLFGQLHDTCVLTPHDGEFARLFPDIAARLEAPAAAGPAASRLDAARAAAARAGCVVLLKGPDTVIAAPDGRAAVNAAHHDQAAPWLATAGSGDVLAGLITGLLARGLPPLDAAAIGAWLHTECALWFGPGLIAEDLPEQMPAVLKSLGL